MGWITRALGLTLKVPTAGSKNWDTGLIADFVDKISAHDHTGSGKGLQLGGSAIAAAAITPAKMSITATGFASNPTPSSGSTSGVTDSSEYTALSNLVVVNLYVTGTLIGGPAAKFDLTLPVALAGAKACAPLVLVVSDTTVTHGYLTISGTAAECKITSGNFNSGLFLMSGTFFYYSA